MNIYTINLRSQPFFAVVAEANWPLARSSLRSYIDLMDSNYEGRQDHIRDWQTPSIETFRNVYPDRDYEIRMETDEFTCVCPKTGLPDFATLILTYVPGESCLELKSFKEYLLAFRNQGIFHENVVNKISDDLIRTLRPRRLHLEGRFHNRGGIVTTVQRTYANA